MQFFSFLVWEEQSKFEGVYGVLANNLSFLTFLFDILKIWCISEFICPWERWWQLLKFMNMWVENIIDQVRHMHMATKSYNFVLDLSFLVLLDGKVEGTTLEFTCTIPRIRLLSVSLFVFYFWWPLSTTFLWIISFQLTILTCILTQIGVISICTLSWPSKTLCILFIQLPGICGHRVFPQLNAYFYFKLLVTLSMYEC